MNKGRAVVLMCVLVGIVAVGGVTLARRDASTRQTESRTSASGLADYTAQIETDLDDRAEKTLFVSTENGAGNLQFEIFHVETREARHNVLRLIHLGPSSSLSGDRMDISYRPIDDSISFQKLAEVALGKPVTAQKGEIHAHGVIESIHVIEYSIF